MKAVYIGDDVEKDFLGPRRLGMHSINILPKKPDIVPDDSYVKSLNSLQTVLSKFELTNWKFLSVQINLFWSWKTFNFLCILE